jgi:hypothetical protein
MSANRAHGNKSRGIYYLHKPPYKNAAYISIVLLVDLLVTGKDGENRKENRREGQQCTSMKLIKGPKAQNAKGTNNMAPHVPLSAWSGSALCGAV